jgi:CHASE2 domain-containing sensor protein
MVATRRRRLSQRAAVGLSLACWAVLAVLQGFGVFEIPDLKVFDLRHRLRGPRPATDSIAVVEVDDRTLQAYRNRWPLSRGQYAVLVAALEEGGAAAVGFDLLFLHDDPNDGHGDSLLAVVSSQFENVVHSALFVGEPSIQGGAGLPPGAEEILRRHGITAEGIGALSGGIVTLPYTELADSARAIAHNSVVVDRDGAVRRLPLLLRHGGKLYPSLSLRLLAVARGLEELRHVRPMRGGLGVRWRPGGAEQFLPLASTGATAIDFAGDREQFARRVSMLDVVRWYPDSTAQLRAAFQGRFVLVGSTAVGQAAADLGSTPFSEATPLVYVHANALNALLSGRFLRPVSIGMVVAVLAMVSMLLGILLARLPLAWAVGATIGTVLLVGGLDYGLFVLWSLDVPATMALLLPPFAYASVEGYAFLSLERETRARERELQVARTIQQRLLPASPPNTPGLDVFGVNIPALEVGGDYFDWIPLRNGHLAVALGDVCGKGVGAALLMSHLCASLRSEMREAASPASILEAISASFYRATHMGEFATFFLAVIAPDANELRFCSAGHDPPLLVQGTAVEPLAAMAIPLGLDPDTRYQEEVRRFESGDWLVIYSDGVTTAQCKEDMYDLPRLSKCVATQAGRSRSAGEMGTAILDELRCFCRGDLGADDVTLVVVRRT